MNPPPWLAEFHRRWQAARGRKSGASSRPFGVDWEALLDDAGLHAAEDRATAEREASKLETEGRILLKRHRFRRYRIERLSLPLNMEAWLRRPFDAPDPRQLHEEALAAVHAAREATHPLWPAEWNRLCAALAETFEAGRSPRPFSWRQPENLRQLLRILHSLTAQEWPAGTPVRAASVALGLDSKSLERHQRSLASALSQLFGAPTSLADLGLVMSEAMLLFHGPLTLHFEEGRISDFEPLAGVSQVSFVDLQRAVKISTPATRLLTIENAKTTFRQFAAANSDGATLLVASSFPSAALRVLLEKLPSLLTYHHFGDTDPTGWQILAKLREISPRPVAPFAMAWRPCSRPQPLTARDRQLLPQLLASPGLQDGRDEIGRMVAEDSRGDCEQESLGPPVRRGWPFF